MLIKEKEISEVKNIMRYKKNITLKLENISSYFTGKNKIITLSLIILMLSLINITLGSSNNSNSVLSLFGLSSTSVSALSYESNVGIGFTFNPTLAISFSSSDLVISNLTPGTTSDSNNIVVSVSTNAAYGYTLSTNVGSNDITSPYYGSSDLVHSNNSNNGSNSSNHVFSSVAIDANYSDLSDFSTNADINTWGYSTSLDNGTTWSSYNGLSTSTNTTLVDSNDMTSSAIDFKIAAKASDNQTSGVYSNVINFMAVSKVAPTSLLDAFIASGAEQYNGYFKMQDMTSDICNAVDDALIPSELQLIDIRDNKVYWVAKLADKNCWMTQNLDLDIKKDRQGNVVPLNSETTSLVDGSLSGAYENGYTYSPDPNRPDTPGVYNGLITWTPSNSTNKSYTLTSPSDWENSNTEPYSYDKGEFYPDSIVNKQLFAEHASSGNYYNWSAAIASNSSYSTSNTERDNSVCPKGWRLPVEGEHTVLYNQYRNDSDTTAFGLLEKPLLYVRAGLVTNKNGVGYSGGYGCYWSSTSYRQNYSYYLNFSANYVSPDRNIGDLKSYGFSVRCLAR